MRYLQKSAVHKNYFNDADCIVYNNTANLMRVVNSCVEEISTWKIKDVHDLVATNQLLLEKDRLRI